MPREIILPNGESVVVDDDVSDEEALQLLSSKLEEPAPSSPGIASGLGKIFNKETIRSMGPYAPMAGIEDIFSSPLISGYQKGMGIPAEMVQSGWEKLTQKPTDAAALLAAMQSGDPNAIAAAQGKPRIPLIPKEFGRFMAYTNPLSAGTQGLSEGAAALLRKMGSPLAGIPGGLAEAQAGMYGDPLIWATAGGGGVAKLAGVVMTPSMYIGMVQAGKEAANIFVKEGASEDFWRTLTHAGISAAFGAHLIKNINKGLPPKKAVEDAALREKNDYEKFTESLEREHIDPKEAMAAVKPNEYQRLLEKLEGPETEIIPLKEAYERLKKIKLPGRETKKAPKEEVPVEEVVEPVKEVEPPTVGEEGRYVSPDKERVHKEFEVWAKQPGSPITPEQTEVAKWVYDRWADNVYDMAGVDPYESLSIKGATPAEILKQRTEISGEIEKATGKPLPDKMLIHGDTVHSRGKIIIRALQAPNFSTMIHELVHAFVPLLPGSARVELLKWAKIRDFAEWTPEHEEKLANLHEKYVREEGRGGRAPHPGLETVFGKMRQWMSEIYARVKGTPLNLKMTPEIKSFFDKMYAEPKGMGGKEAPTPTLLASIKSFLSLMRGRPLP